VCACVHVCVRACVRVCVRACVCACVCVCAWIMRTLDWESLTLHHSDIQLRAERERGGERERERGTEEAMAEGERDSRWRQREGERGHGVRDKGRYASVQGVSQDGSISRA